MRGEKCGKEGSRESEVYQYGLRNCLPQIHESSSLPCLPRICNVELGRPMIGGGSTAHSRREGSSFRDRPPSIP
jgi:hypothetical protein